MLSPYAPGLPGAGGVGETLTTFTPGGAVLATPLNVSATNAVVMELRPGGGVSTHIDLRTKYARDVQGKDLMELRAIARRMVADAMKLSQGPLTLATLRKMGHPYGRIGPKRGRRRKALGRLASGTSNLAAINLQSGKLAQSWNADVKVTGDGARIELYNTDEVAAYLAFGTRSMVAHGPFTMVPARLLPLVMGEWRRATTWAYWRFVQRQALKAQTRGLVS